MNKNKFFYIVIVFLIFFLIDFVSAAPPQPCDFFSESSLYNNQPIQIGQVISAYTPAEVLCGTFTVTVEGDYGPLHCQGDDPAIGGDDGAYGGDTISFYIEGDNATASGTTTWASGQSYTVDLTSVNSAPTISSISGLTGTVKGGSSQTVTANINDVDHPKGTADQTRIFVCTTDSASSTGCDVGHYCNTTLGATTSPSCSFNVESDDILHNYYVFLVDEHDEITASTAGSYTSDSTPPTIDSFVPSNNSWTNDITPDITLTSNEASACKYDASQDTEYGSKATTMTGSTTSHTTTFSSLGSEGDHWFYFQCSDTVGNPMLIANEYDYLIKYDGTNPLAGTVSILNSNWNITHTKNTTIDFNWTGFSDALSGINQYHYAFTDAQDGSNPNVSSSGQLTSASQGSNTIYVWAEDNAGNYGASASFSVIVDTVVPSVSFSEGPADLKSFSTSNFNVTAAITDATTSISGTPEYRYYIGADSWSSWTNMTFVSGDDWMFSIAVPGADWDSRKNETIYYEVRVNDTLDNQNTQAGTEVIDDFFLITFNIADRILNQSLSGLILMGDEASCTGGGCSFDYNYTIQEQRGTTPTIIITKSGFQPVVYPLTVSGNTIINISMNDTQDPTIDALNFVARTGSGNQNYYVDITVNSSDNLAVSEVLFIYGIGGPTKDLDASLSQAGDSWTTTLGPFTSSMKIYSTSNSTDYYDNKGGNNNPILWFLFIPGGTGGDQVTTTVGGSSGGGGGVITSPGLIGTYFDALVKILESSKTLEQGNFVEIELTLINKGKEPDRDTWLTYYLIGPDGKKYFETREQIYEIPVGKTKLSKKLKSPENAEPGIWQFHVEYQTSMQPLIHIWDSFEIVEEGGMGSLPIMKNNYIIYIIIGNVVLFILFIIILFKRRRKKKGGKSARIVKTGQRIGSRGRIKQNLNKIRSKHALMILFGSISVLLLIMIGPSFTGFVVGTGKMIKNLSFIVYFMFIIGCLGVLSFVYKKKIQGVVKIGKRNKYATNSLKGLIKKKVYTDDGEYVGKVVDIILNENKIDSLRIKLDKKLKKKVKGIIVKYKNIRNVKHVVIVDGKILERLNI